MLLRINASNENNDMLISAIELLDFAKDQGDSTLIQSDSELVCLINELGE